MVGDWGGVCVWVGGKGLIGSLFINKHVIWNTNTNTPQQKHRTEVLSNVINYTVSVKFILFRSPQTLHMSKINTTRLCKQPVLVRERIIQWNLVVLLNHTTAWYITCEESIFLLNYLREADLQLLFQNSLTSPVTAALAHLGSRSYGR